MCVSGSVVDKIDFERIDFCKADFDTIRDDNGYGLGRIL